jgi:hypothetical protein
VLANTRLKRLYRGARQPSCVQGLSKFRPFDLAVPALSDVVRGYRQERDRPGLALNAGSRAEILLPHAPLHGVDGSGGMCARGVRPAWALSGGQR